MPKLNNYSYQNKILARGFTSVVYKGIDTMTNEKVAIKAIDQAVLDEPQKKKLLTNQLNIQWELRQQPYIVQIKAQFYQNDCIYIVTEFCQYGDLKSRIKQKGKFIQPKAVSYMLDIIKGFQTLVKHNIVHRDLKTANILISKLGVKIGDFGYAYKVNKNQLGQNLNIPSAGSPLYMAPEVLEDGRNSSHLSDIWSIGVIFFQMLTGHLPFPARNKQGLIKLIDKTGIRGLLPQNLSLKSKQFILRTLKKDPTKRMTPQQLINFQFDDQILFTLKQHRQKKMQQRKKRQQEGRRSVSSSQQSTNEIQQKIKVYSKKEESKNKHEEQSHSHHNNNPQTDKTGHKHKQNSKQHEPQKPSSNHHSSIHPDHLVARTSLKAPPQLLKNYANFDQFDHNNHTGKSLLDPLDIHKQKFKRKSHEKKAFISQIQNDKVLEQTNKNKKQMNHAKEIQDPIKEKKSSHDNQKQRQIYIMKHPQSQIHKEKQIHKQLEIFSEMKHQQISKHEQVFKHIKTQVANQKVGKLKEVHNQHNQNTKIHLPEQNKVLSKHLNQKSSYHSQIKKHNVQEHVDAQNHRFHQNTMPIHKQTQKLHKTDSSKSNSSHSTSHSHHNSKIKRGDSMFSVQSQHQGDHALKKEEIIQILLNQIDIIRFLSRIIHKIQELHHLRLSENQNGHNRHSPSRKQSFQSHQSHQKVDQHSSTPQIYFILKQLIYKSILQIEKLDFLSDQQAYKFFRSQQFDQIKTILDTYKTKLKLVDIKELKWKGMKNLQHQLDQQVILVYNTIMDRIGRYEGKNLDKDSMQLRKLNRKIETLDYLLVLRYDYFILQRQEMFIDETANHQGKSHGHCNQIKLIIEGNHKHESSQRKSLEDLKTDLKPIQKKMKQIKLI